MAPSSRSHGVFFAVLRCLVAACVMLAPAALRASQPYDAFLEPDQVVDISTPFRDRISAIHVKEGDRVKAGQLLAELESRVLQAKLASAKVAAAARGRIDSAAAQLAMQKNRLAMLEELERSGNARPQEMVSAKTDLAVAQAQAHSARDEQRLKELEVDIIRAEIEEKRLRSPVDGVVVKIHKQPAELIGGADQQSFMTVVQLHPLRATFHLPPEVAAAMKPGGKAMLGVGGQSVTGEVDFLSPVINAQSGTVEVRFKLANPDHRLVSGSRCTLAAENISGGPSHDGAKKPATAAKDKGPVQ